MLMAHLIQIWPPWSPARATGDKISKKQLYTQLSGSAQNFLLGIWKICNIILSGL